MNAVPMKTVAKIAAIVAGLGLVAMSFAAFTPQVGAQSASAQAQINALLVQVAKLQAQLTALQGGVAFTRDLTIGSSGSDVTRLQQFLIARGHAIPAGATGYFGEQTRAALAGYQSANSIVPPAGYFGSVTRTNVNAKLAITPPVTPPSNNDDDEDEDDLSGDAMLSGARIEEGDDEEVEEGETAEIALVTFDVEDGDAQIEELELGFRAASGNDEDKPWNTFETVTISVDGDELASERVSSELDWRESDREPYIFRFEGLDFRAREGETVELVIEIEARDDIDGIDDDENWTLSLEDNAVRGTDASDNDIETDGSGDITFAVVEEGNTSNDDDEDDGDAEVVSTSARATQVSGDDNDYATFEMTIDLKAFGEDIYIPRDADDAFTYEIVNSDGEEVTTSTSESVTLSSDADIEGDYFVIREDDSEEFTFRVVFNPEAADEGDDFKFQLLTVEYNDSEDAPDASWAARPAGNYDTSYVYISD